MIDRIWQQAAWLAMVLDLVLFLGLLANPLSVGSVTSSFLGLSAAALGVLGFLAEEYRLVDRLRIAAIATTIVGYVILLMTR